MKILLKLVRFNLLLLTLLVSGCQKEETEFRKTTNDNTTTSTDNNITIEELSLFEADQAYQGGALETLNGIRLASGLQILKENSFLNSSSYDHSNYLKTNELISHEESIDLKGFTGKNPDDRAVAAGYPAYYVLENIATAENEYSAVDGLFTAIYHRFGFLDYAIDEVGFGVATQYQGVNIYTFNMGSEKLSDLCLNDEFAEEEEYYYSSICANNKNQSASKVEQILDSYYESAPDFVIFPYKDAVDVAPVFYSETPDPLPNRYMTGNPISIEFNPKIANSVEMHEFSLINLNTNELLSTIKIQRENDPNERFSSLQFAIFPIKRLDYNTTYEATVLYQLSEMDEIKTYKWQFTTKAFERLLIVKNSENTFHIEPDVLYAVYFDSPEDASLLQSSELENYGVAAHSPNSAIYINSLDSMTCYVKVKGGSNDYFKIINNSLNNGNAQVNLYIK